MNTAAASTPHAGRDAGAARRWPAPLPAAASILLHVLVLMLLLSAARQHHGGAPSTARVRALNIVITLGPETPPQQPQKPQPTATPVPQLQPRPSPQSTPARPAVQTAPPHSETHPAAPMAQAPAPNQEPDDILGSIYDNWLAPPGLNKPFRCHVRIDYKADGSITQINFAPGCGNAVLVDSLSRAIWKTQPLPLGKDKNQAGSMELDLAQ